jgi:hypothetical protein
MANNSKNDRIFDRRDVIRAAIIRLLENLTDSEIENIRDTIKSVDLLCKKGILDNQLITRLDIVFNDANNEMRSVLIVYIDWDRHEFHIKNGDRHIILDRHLIINTTSKNDYDVSLKSISETLDEIGKIMHEAAHYLHWKRCSHFTYFRPNVDLTTLHDLGYGRELTEIQKQEVSDYGTFLLEIGATPTNLDELRVLFLSSTR